MNCVSAYSSAVKMEEIYGKYICTIHTDPLVELFLVRAGVKGRKPAKRQKTRQRKSARVKIASDARVWRMGLVRDICWTRRARRCMSKCRHRQAWTN